MLNPEDCKPGVEVIAIKNHPNTFKLSIGMIYTIDRYDESYCQANTLSVTPGSVISLNEVSFMHGYQPAFELDQFKLRDPEEFNKLFDMSNIDADLYKEDHFENI